jgi:hypothetical protein
VGIPSPASAGTATQTWASVSSSPVTAAVTKYSGRLATNQVTLARIIKSDSSQKWIRARQRTRNPVSMGAIVPGVESPENRFVIVYWRAWLSIVVPPCQRLTIGVPH